MNTSQKPALIKTSAWLAVQSKLPLAGERVLAFGVNVYCTEQEVHEAIYADGCWRTPATYSAAPDENVELENVTHWMPLPDPPNLTTPPP